MSLARIFIVDPYHHHRYESADAACFGATEQGSRWRWSVMPVVAEVAVPAEEFVLGQVLRDVGEYRARLTQFVPLRDQLVPYFWIAEDDPDHVAEILREQALVEAVTRYDERAGQTLYGLEWAGPLDDFLSILMEQDLLVTEASGTPERWTFELLASEGDDIAAFQRACNDFDIDIDICSISRASPSSLDRLGLTEPQRDILQLAYEEGYFEIPQGTTVTELGAQLDISPQAASKRLRRALAAVVTHVLTDPS